MIFQFLPGGKLKLVGRILFCRLNLG